MDLSREGSTVYQPVTREELDEIRKRCLLVGPRNCWTGTSGAAAADAWRLAAEAERLSELVAMTRTVLGNASFSRHAELP